MNLAHSREGELSIGQMAKLNGISEKTLRVYHKKGILVPCRIDQETGFRYYRLDQCATLDMIQQMKALGFSLDEIGCILRQNDIDSLEKCVRAKIEDIEREEARLDLVKSLGRSILDTCTFSRQHPEFRTIHYEILPDRRIIRIAPFEVLQNLSKKEVVDSWERILRKCKRLFLDGTYPFTLFRNISEAIPIANLRNSKVCFCHAILFVDQTYPNLYDKAEIVPEGLFATYYDDNFSDESGLYAEFAIALHMVEELRSNGYEPTGDYIGEVIAETPVFCTERGGMLSRLQIPVRPQ